MDIFSDPLGFTSSSPRFGPYRSTDFSDDRHVGAPSLLSSSRSHRDEPLEIRQSRRKRPRRSYSDSEGSEEVAFTDDEDDLVLAGERTERVLTLSPTRFESGSSVFVPKRKQPTIPFSHGFFALSFWDTFRAHFNFDNQPSSTGCDPVILGFQNVPGPYLPCLSISADRLMRFHSFPNPLFCLLAFICAVISDIEPFSIW